MHKESDDNIMYVCPECTDAKKEAVQRDIESVLKGSAVTHVKKGFVDEKSQQTEYMWVKIKTVDLEKKIIYGTLDNIPINVTTVTLNDAVEVRLEEIVEIYPFI